MKYGMRERVSGIIIVVALGVIFIPLLFDEPESEQQRPEPVLTIDPPVDVERRDVADPTPPSTLGANESASSGEQQNSANASTQSQIDPGPAEQVTAGTNADTDRQNGAGQGASSSASTSSSSTDSPRQEPAEDPIAALARQADQREGRAATSAVQGGEWAVQVGSFGESANADRLMNKLRDQGYPAYSRARSNSLTTVYVGPFAASEDAEGVMGELKSRENLQGLLVKVDS